MYKLLLIAKYLRTRRIAWASLGAVMLCTAMVIVVISVMGGWLRMFKASFQGLSGDVIVQGVSLTGFPHYDEMAERMEATPQVAAAVPVLQTFGLINLQNKIRSGVEVIGYPVERIGEVNNFPDSLYLQHELRASPPADPDLWERDYLERRGGGPRPTPSFDKPNDPDFYREQGPGGRAIDRNNDPGMIVGVGVANLYKDEEGNIDRGVGVYPFPVWALLTTLAVDGDSAGVDLAGNKAERRYVVVDDSRTGVFQADQASVYVPFDVLQRDLRMDRREERDLVTGEVYVDPARTRSLQVKLAPGVSLADGKAAVQQVVNAVKAERGIDERLYPIDVQTWEETQATFIGAVEKEKLLLVILFGVISLVAVFLIFCIFYMIVMEKTRDIGIVKSVGATGPGVAAVFVGYGLVIGLLGASLGLLAGGLVVWNINAIHDALRDTLGLQIYSPEVYAFDTLPNTMDGREVAVIVVVAVLSSVLGAVLPAIRAARMNPVEALRFE